MNIAEARKLLEEVSVIDNRKLSQELVQAWYKIVGHIDYRVAERALLLARRDPNIAYVEPKHIMAKVPQAIGELNDEQRSNQSAEDDWHGEPMPICREHGLGILNCEPCCKLLSEKGPRNNPRLLHEWAITNVYRADSLVGNL